MVLGLEIRAKVCEYVRARIDALREECGDTAYQNASCFRTNCMRYLPNYFTKGQVFPPTTRADHTHSWKKSFSASLIHISKQKIIVEELLVKQC